MSPVRLMFAVAAVALVAAIAVGLAELHGASRQQRLTKLAPAQMRARLAGSPAPLAALHVQGGEILSGGLTALRARLARLRGYPLVLNKWASWCQPCRAEFGVFQHVSVSLGHSVAFLGIDAGDTSRAAAVGFLRSFPVSYPSYYDPAERAAAALTDDAVATPVTAFYNVRGALYIHQGPYASVARLEADVRRYALAG